MYQTWEELENSIKNCQKCNLCKARQNIVFGLGNKEPVYEYEEISRDIQGKLLTGDIIQLFKERESERESER